MMENMIKYLTNPMTAKLLMELEGCTETTAKQLAARCPDIPHATLYRSLNRMCKDGILQIVCENKIRGTYEKVYALNNNYTTNINQVLFDEQGNRVENFGEEYLKCFIQFAKGLIKEFQDFRSAPCQSQTDYGGFFILTTQASEKQMQTLLQDISNRMEQLKEEPCKEAKKMRSVAVIVPPSSQNLSLPETTGKGRHYR